jgi:hypothetical protein
VRKYWWMLGILNHFKKKWFLQETLYLHKRTSNRIGFDALAIILSLYAPDHDQDEQVLDA